MRRIKPAISAYAWQLCLCYGKCDLWITEDCAALCFGLHDDPVDYCKALRQVIEASSTPERLKALWGRNSVTIEMLRPNLRDLGTQVGELEEGRRTARGRRDAERLARGYSGIHSRRIGAVKKRWEAKGRSYGVAALRFM